MGLTAKRANPNRKIPPVQEGSLMKAIREVDSKTFAQQRVRKAATGLRARRGRGRGGPIRTARY